MRFVLHLAWGLLAQASATQEFQVTVRTKDGSTFTGTTRLPAKLTVSTKFGDVSHETRTLTLIQKSGEAWTINAPGGTVTGKLSLDALSVATAGGSLKIPIEEILNLQLQPSAPPIQATPVPAVPVPPPPPSAAFKGFDVRKRFTDNTRQEKLGDCAVLLSNGKHAALIDQDSADVVFVELAGGKTTRVRADAGANHLFERNGKLYVANAEAKTLTVIDAASFQTLKQISMPGPPRWITAPAFGPFIYVALSDWEPSLQVVNTQTDTLADPMGYSNQERNLLGRPYFVEVTADNRVMVVKTGGLADPTLFEVSGHDVTLVKRMGESYWPSFHSDLRAGRTYFGSLVFSADLQTRITAIPNADMLKPHPSRRILFGRKCRPYDRHQIELNKGTTVLLLDEDTFANIGEIEIGDRVLSLLPAEDVLYVVSETRIYPVDLKSQVPAEAFARPKPVRNNVDLAALAASSTTTRRTSFQLSKMGGWALLEDARTLAVAQTEKAELLYIDTTDGAELRKVGLEFQPGAMAVQGDTLYVIRTNSSVLHALDAASGKPKKDFKIPGDPLVRVACAPKGRIFVSNAKGHVLSIDPASGSASTTEAKGLFLQVDPKGQFVYAGRTSPQDYGVEVEKDKDGTTTFYYDNWGYRSFIRKYAVSGATLRQVAVNDNTAVNGRSMVLSPDGSRIAMAGGGGWRPKRTGGGAGGYTIAIYDTKDMTTMLGQVDLGAYPETIAFHPVLDLGVALKSEGELTLFKVKSLAQVKRWKAKGSQGISHLPGSLMFAGRGETLLYCTAGDLGDPQQKGRLLLIPLELGAEDKAALQKAYGKAATPADSAKTLQAAEEAERKGDKAAALRLYRQLIQEDPSSDGARQASKRILALEEAGAPAPSTAGPAAGLLKTANALFDSGEPERALRYYKRIVDEHPASPEAKDARARIKEIEKK